ncbi:MAG: N-acetylmuramoyl-L-alanine amidase [Vulcanimicrobiota bacterium]
MKRKLSHGSPLILLFCILLSVTVAAQEEPYKIGKAATRHLHCMGQSWKVSIYQTSGPDVVMLRADDPVLFEVSRALGKRLRWSESERTMYGEAGSKLALGQTALPVHGKDKELELPSQVVNGAVYLPSTALDGLMNCRVSTNSAGAIYVEPVLEQLSFSENSSKSTELLIRTSVPVRKKMFNLSRPARTVIDLVGVAVPDEFESVEHPILGEIRVGQFQAAPSIARIVVPADSGIKVEQKRTMDLFEHQLVIDWPSSIRPIAERESAERVETVQIKPTKMPDRKVPVASIKPAANPPRTAAVVQVEEQSAPQPPVKSGRTLLNSVSWEGKRLKLEFSEPVEYRWSRVGAGTDRFVVDFPNVIFPTKKQSLNSSIPGLQGVRIVQNMPEPQPIVRLVCDLSSSIAVETEPKNEKILYLQFPGGSAAAALPRGMGHTSQKMAQSTGGAGRTVCIDAGHGGSDPGALNRSVGINEKTVTLDISLKLAAYLKAQGWNVIMTRTSDRDVSWAGSSAKQELGARARMANEHGADLFVSIHANASVNSDVQGSSIHWFKSSDYRLAQLMESGVMDATGRKNRGLVKNRFYVLAHTEMPAVLIETAFLTNSTEGRLLADPAYRDKIARGIASGLQVYASRTFPVAAAKNE